MGELEAYALTPELDADLTWVAPGDDGYAGTAVRYDLRVATTPLTDATFAAATSVPTLVPLHGGLIEVLHLPALPAETTLYYALRAVDGSGNWSALSNVASLTTPGVSPAIPPLRGQIRREPPPPALLPVGPDQKRTVGPFQSATATVRAFPGGYPPTDPITAS